MPTTETRSWSPPVATGPVAPGDVTVAGGGVIPAAMIERWGSVQGVYDHFNTLNEEMWDEQWAYETGEDARLAAAIGGWEEGIGTLEGARERILTDPNLEAAFTSLGEMASEDYDAIGEAGRASLHRELASGVNRAQSDRAAALRRAGLSGSGMDIENAPLYTAIGSSGLAEVNADIEIANQEARDRATMALGDLGLRREGLLGNFDLALAGLQSDVPTSGYDPWLPASIDWALDQEDIRNEQFDEAMAAYNESQDWGLLEWLRPLVEPLADPISFLLGLEGTSFYRNVPGL